MDIEERIRVIESNLRKEVSSKVAATLLGISVRQFDRIRKDYVITGEISLQRGCILPFNEEEAVALFRALVFRRKSEKLSEVLQRVCVEVKKNYETVRKVKIYSYPSLYYYKPKSTQLVVPLKRDEEYFGGIMFEVGRENDSLNVCYVSEIISENEMIDGCNEKSYVDLMELIIKVMSQTYFQNVKNRTKEKIDPIEKFERYYKDFNSHIKKSGVEKELKNIVSDLLDENNNKIDTLTNSSIDSPFSNSYSPESSVSPLPDDDDDDYNCDCYGNIIITNSNNNNDDYGLIDVSFYLTPPPSPHFRSRSPSRSRSPLRYNNNYSTQREEFIPIHQLVGFSAT